MSNQAFRPLPEFFFEFWCLGGDDELLTPASGVQLCVVIYQHGDIFTLPRNEDVTRGAESRQIPKPTVRLTRFTEKERITVLEHAVVRSEVEAVVRVFRTRCVRVPRIKLFDFILVFQDFAYHHIAIDDMLDGRALYKMERSIWKCFGLTDQKQASTRRAYSSIHRKYPGQGDRTDASENQKSGESAG